MTAYPERIRKALERACAQLSSGGIQAALLDLQKVVTKVPKGEEGLSARRNRITSNV